MYLNYTIKVNFVVSGCILRILREGLDFFLRSEVLSQNDCGHNRNWMYACCLSEDTLPIFKYSILLNSTNFLLDFDKLKPRREKGKFQLGDPFSNNELKQKSMTSSVEFLKRGRFKTLPVGFLGCRFSNWRRRLFVVFVCRLSCSDEVC